MEYRPIDPPEDLSECKHCGKQIDSYNEYCSSVCYFYDNE